MTPPPKELSKIEIFYWFLQISCLISAAIQFTLSQESENVVATIYCAASSTLLIQYLLRSGCAATTPLSSLSLLGLNITSILTSLISMSLYGRPLIENLRAPELTFPILASVQLIAVITHWAYRNMAPVEGVSKIIAEKIFRPIGLFSIPHISTVWAMGLAGALSQFLGHAETGDVGGKAVQALAFLCWIPFLIPFYYSQAGSSFCSIRKQLIFLGMFILLMILIGMARNIRQIMMIGPMQLAFGYFIYIAVQKIPAAKSTIRSFIIFSLIGVAALHGVSDLTTAMGVAREKRETATYKEIIAETLNALFIERERLDEYRGKSDLAAKVAFYDETYIPNPVLIRLSETKFHDNMLFFSSRYLLDRKDEILQGLKNKLIVILPETFSRVLFRDFEKKDHLYSMGDYYLSLIFGPHLLSNFVTGSIWADFYNVFEGWYMLAVVPYMILMYITFDSLTLRSGSTPLVSAVGICTTWIMFIYGLGGESAPAKLSMLARELPQRILFYLTFFWVMRIIQDLFSCKQPSVSTQR